MKRNFQGFDELNMMGSSIGMFVDRGIHFSNRAIPQLLEHMTLAEVLGEEININEHQSKHIIEVGHI